MPRFYRSLPIVDVGAHTGGDLIVPAALRGHRVYAYEPTPRTFHALVANLRRSNISFATKPRGFRNATAGTVLVRHAAVRVEGVRRVAVPQLQHATAVLIETDASLLQESAPMSTSCVSVLFWSRQALLKQA